MLRSLATAIILCAITIAPCLAQSAPSGGAQGATGAQSAGSVQSNSAGAQGATGRTSNLTGSGPNGMGRLSTWSTGSQSSCNLPTGLGNLAGAPPPTVLDSLVKDSGYNDMIYGDEGTFGPPPYMDFLPIGAGLGGAGATVSGTTNYGGLASMWDLPNPSSSVTLNTAPLTTSLVTSTVNPADVAAAAAVQGVSASAATAANAAYAASNASAATAGF